MGFPGGAKLAKLAQEFRQENADKKELDRLFPRAYLEKDSLDFSLSGLKSAVKRYIDSQEIIDENFRKKVAYAFEEAVFDVLLKKLFLAAEKYNTKSLILAGGVSANSELRDRIQEKATSLGYNFLAPVKNLYTGDNAAMIGIRAYYEKKF